jgi:hypothetical protein
MNTLVPGVVAAAVLVLFARRLWLAFRAPASSSWAERWRG